ncbi:MAG: cupredoxin domain-containing protein [Acidimicrobiia bacterium]
MRKSSGVGSLSVGSLSVVSIVAVGVLAACGSGSGSKASTGSYHKATTTPTAPAAPTSNGPITTIAARDFAFTPTSITLTKGDNTLKVTNSGSVKHNLTVEGLKLNQDLPPGATQTVSLTAKPGSYPFHCEYHPTQMKGTITVG